MKTANVGHTTHDMILLVDGPDGTGKSTVCSILSRNLELPVVKMPNMKKYFELGLTEEFSELFNETILQFKDRSFILDRGFPSSLVYNKVYNRGANLEYLKNFEDRLGCQVFILYGDDQVLFERRPQDEIISREKRIEVNAEYQRLAKDRGWSRIDTTSRFPDEVARQIQYAIR